MYSRGTNFAIQGFLDADPALDFLFPFLNLSHNFVNILEFIAPAVNTMSHD